MTRAQLSDHIRKKRSFLCIGLDSDPARIPSFLDHETDPVFEFNRQLIEATHDLCVAYKLNTAFYESSGARGWTSMQKTLDHIPPGIFTIADAKRGDIGNTTDLYSRAFFDKESSGLQFDAITVSPYMGKDSVEPYLRYPGKWAIVLALTSNEGSADFQMIRCSDNDPETKPAFLYERVLQTAQTWGSTDNMMFVIGATKAEQLASVRKLVPHHFLLVPGVGVQGGNLNAVARHGMNEHVGLLVNVSRQIIYAAAGKDFAAAAREKALLLSKEMEQLLAERVA